jgi:hypothetical protein
LIFVNLALGIVNRGFASQHHLTKLAVAGAIGFGRPIDGLLGQPAHPQELFFQFIQSLLKTAAHYPNLPVT